jgi:hypothetical protein
MRPRLAITLLAAGAAASGSGILHLGCSTPDCAETATCAVPAGDGGLGQETSSPWACLDQPPLAGEDPTTQVAVDIVTYDPLASGTLPAGVDGGSDLILASGYTGAPGVSAEACSPLDVFCAYPRTQGAVTDDSGTARLTLPGDFSGYYQLERPDLFPSLLYTGRFVAGDTHVTYPEAAPTKAELSALSLAFHVAVNEQADAGPGYLTAIVFDCNDRRASGVSFSLTNVSAGVQIYLQNGIPTNATQTTADGAGAFMNVPQGSVTLASTLVTEGNRSLGTTNVYVRSGSLTNVFVRPRVR